MAATRLIALHANKGRTVAQSLSARTDYAMNPEKTEKGELVTAYGCDPVTVDEEFMLQKRQFEHLTGRTRKDSIIAYQIRQSFKPGEISPEEANRLGRETALRFTKGWYSFVVATHTDRTHIHNHIVFNSVSMDGTQRFRFFLRAGRAVQKVSDLVCLENGLSIITPKPYGERIKRTLYPQKETIRSIICKDIDTVLAKNPKDFSSFLEMMVQAGYMVKQVRHVALKGKAQERYVRMSSLGEGYTEADVRAWLLAENKQESQETAMQKRSEEKTLVFIPILSTMATMKRQKLPFRGIYRSFRRDRRQVRRPEHSQRASVMTWNQTKPMCGLSSGRFSG